MSLFFDIPKVHQVDLLAGWLRPNDIVKLDKAVMSHQHRKELIDLLSSHDCVLGYLEFLWLGTMEWIIARQVKFSEIAISNRFLSDAEMVEKVMRIIGPSLKSLDYNCRTEKEEDDEEDDESLNLIPISLDQILYHYARYLTNLESLRLHSGAVNGMLSVLICNNRYTLKCFELSDCKNVCASILKACCDSPCLEKVAIEDCDISDDAFSFHSNANTTCRELRFCCDVLSEHVAYFTCIFTNLLYVDVRLFVADLIRITQHCPLVEKAKIMTVAPLSLSDATTITQNWKHIQQLEILPNQGETHLCEHNVVLQFIVSCPQLQQLTLAEPLENTHFTKTASAGISISSAHSNLLELTVSELSKRSLADVMQKCPHLQSLCIHRPTPTSLSGYVHAESSLHILNNTKVKHLYLGNCTSFSNKDLCRLHSVEKLVLHNMGSVPIMDGSALLQLAQQCPHLHTLHIHRCLSIHHSNILPLLQVAPHLRDFEYSISTLGKLCQPTPVEMVLEQTMKLLYPRLVNFSMRS